MEETRKQEIRQWIEKMGTECASLNKTRKETPFGYTTMEHDVLLAINLFEAAEAMDAKLIFEPWDLKGSEYEYKVSFICNETKFWTLTSKEKLPEKYIADLEKMEEGHGSDDE